MLQKVCIYLRLVQVASYVYLYKIKGFGVVIMRYFILETGATLFYVNTLFILGCVVLVGLQFYLNVFPVADCLNIKQCG